MGERNRTREVFATGPFELIETPAHAQNAVKSYDLCVEAASIMALSHNVLIRGLNSIYLQAPLVSSGKNSSLNGDREITEFVSYAKCWAEVLDGHHKMEEDFLFPEIEKVAGIGSMEENVEQHHVFLPGLQAYKTYLDTCLLNPSSFSSTHLRSTINSFAPLLVSHLAAEIPTLLALSTITATTTSPSNPWLLQLMERASLKTTQHQNMTTGTAFFFRNLDLGFERGRWADWPPVPGMVWWALQRTVVRWNGGWWRWASCDGVGRLRGNGVLGDGRVVDCV